jgi:hypothetical protein
MFGVSYFEWLASLRKQTFAGLQSIVSAPADLGGDSWIKQRFLGREEAGPPQLVADGRFLKWPCVSSALVFTSAAAWNNGTSWAKDWKPKHENR